MTGYSGSLCLLLLGALLLCFGPVTHFADPVNRRGIESGFAHLWSGQDDSSAIFLGLLLRQPASPYRWADLAESSYQQGDLSRSQYCMSKALVYGRNVPSVLLRAMNLSWASGNTGEALSYSQRVMALTALYDPVVFSMYDRMKLPVTQVLQHWEPYDSRSANAYFRHLLPRQSAGDLIPMWTWMAGRGPVDPSLAQAFFDGLLVQHQYQAAVQAWLPYAARRFQPDYQQSDLIFNGQFEQPLSGVAFDWRITPAEQIAVRQSAGNGESGSVALDISFGDNGRSLYQNVSQFVPVMKPGTYEFSAWVKTDSLDCDEGVRLRVFDAEVPTRLMTNTRQVVGTSVATIRSALTISSPTKLLQVQVIRNPSSCLSSAKTARVFIDNVRLAPQ